jgi:hypothetical protein
MKYTPIEAAMTTAPRIKKSLALFMSHSLSDDLDAPFIRASAAETRVVCGRYGARALALPTPLLVASLC